ncbi:hypothetical protein PFISCL1PPCAC_17502, partial [Pristionchus fissidentatus]
MNLQYKLRRYTRLIEIMQTQHFGGREYYRTSTSQEFPCSRCEIARHADDLLAIVILIGDEHLRECVGGAGDEFVRVHLWIGALVIIPVKQPRAAFLAKRLQLGTTSSGRRGRGHSGRIASCRSLSMNRGH